MGMGMGRGMGWDTMGQDEAGKESRGWDGDRMGVRRHGAGWDAPQCDVYVCWGGVGACCKKGLSSAALNIFLSMICQKERQSPLQPRHEAVIQQGSWA